MNRETRIYTRLVHYAIYSMTYSAFVLQELGNSLKGNMKCPFDKFVRVAELEVLICITFLVVITVISSPSVPAIKYTRNNIITQNLSQVAAHLICHYITLWTMTCTSEYDTYKTLRLYDFQNKFILYVRTIFSFDILAPMQCSNRKCCLHD